MPLVFAYLMLAHPTGHLPSRTERRFLWLTGGAMAVLWLLGVVMTLQPPLKTPLVQCGPHCPNNVFSLGSATEAVTAVQAAMVLAWLGGHVRHPGAARPPGASDVGPRAPLAHAGLAHRDGRRGPADREHAVSRRRAARRGRRSGAIYIGLVAVLPLAILVGLANERLFMGQALAEFVSELARMPAADPEALMAAALRDPSLKVAYRRPGRGTYVDSAGAPVDELPDDMAITWIERDRQPVAAVMYDEDLSGYEPFVQAAGAAA